MKESIVVENVAYGDQGERIMENMNEPKEQDILPRGGSQRGPRPVLIQILERVPDEGFIHCAAPFGQILESGKVKEFTCKLSCNKYKRHKISYMEEAIPGFEQKTSENSAHVCPGFHGFFLSSGPEMRTGRPVVAQVFTKSLQGN